MQKFLLNLWRGWVRPLALMLAVMAPLRSAVVDWNWVPTGSMKPTILEGDLVLVNKLAFDLKVPFTTRSVATWGDPKAGDVVVFFSPKDGTRLVKRVIGLPGETVELRNEVLLVNGVPLHYSLRDAAPYKGEVYEDSNPILAEETLGGRDHAVLVLPVRRALRSFGPYKVPPGSYFMMGDSRDNSFDSRFFGPVARRQIVGSAVGVIVSFDLKKYLLPRILRTGQRL
jgi:signal peptidase I